MAVRAKFKCHQINLSLTGYRQNAEGAQEAFGIPQVVLQPVYAGSDASEEDKAFWDATPNGKLEMTITNPDAAEFFELGKEVYVTFEPVG